MTCVDSAPLKRPKPLIGRVLLFGKGTDSMAARTQGIREATARREDTSAVERLLATLPTDIAANVEDSLAKYDSAEGVMAGMRHDESTKRAFFIVANNEVVQCWTFDGIGSLTDAAKLGVAIERRAMEAHGRLDAAIAAAAYHEVTGRILDH